METLAYLHLACANEEPADSTPVFCGLELLNGVNWKRLSSRAWVTMLCLGVSLTIVGMANAAMAALQQGAQGPEVSRLQASLNRIGYFSGSQTGYFGSLTRDAVIRFQRQVGLTADGIVGPRTQAAIDNYYRPISSSPSTSLTSTQITDLQRKLRDLGYFNGPVTGYFGSITRDAVIRFQQATGLAPDGIPGPITRAEIDRRYNQASRPPYEPITSPNSPSGSQTIRYGSRGAEVEVLQRRLANLGYYNGPIDGSFGSSTYDAVVWFQRNNNLSGDGVVGPSTWAALPTGKPSNSSSYTPITNRPPNNPDAQNRYVVVVPGNSTSLLNRVQLYSQTGAFINTRDRRGTYIQAGRFPNFKTADAQTRVLRQAGLDARIDYQ